MVEDGQVLKERSVSWTVQNA